MSRESLGNLDINKSADFKKITDMLIKNKEQFNGILVVENRTDDPTNAPVGRIWIRTNIT